MADNNLSLKIFLKDENVNEARRISVDASVATSYIFMKEKLETVFPNLRKAQFKITWKDSDGDEITIASDEDFITAFTEMPGNVKVLTIKVMQRYHEPSAFTCPMTDGPSRPLIICDGCDRTISAVRYKCLQCPDFDLCADCEFQGCHSIHVMVRLPNNGTYSPRCARKFMHHINRNLKKSAYTTAKETCRVSRQASKDAGKCKFSGHSSHAAEHEHETEDTSQTCPFNLKDIHALGALVKENLTQLLDAIPNTAQSKTDSENAGQSAMLFDVLRNAVDTFFGLEPCPREKSPNSVEKEKTHAANDATAMETDVSPSAPATSEPKSAEVTSTASNSGIQTPRSEIVQETVSQPQWTFVASNQQPQANVVEASQEAQPKVAFIYHENPIIAEGLVTLHEMGFSNETGVLSSLLEHFKGDVTAVVKAIFDKKI